MLVVIYFTIKINNLLLNLYLLLLILDFLLTERYSLLERYRHS